MNILEDIIMSKVNKLVLASLMLAVLIVLERLVSIQTQFLRISFAYVPIMLTAILLGPAWSAGVAALGDVIGALFLPKGAFFLGFTLSALLTGLIHGLFLYNTKNNRQFLVRLIISTVTVLLFIHIGLTSLWLVIMYKRAFIAFASTRVIAALIMLPIEVGTMFLMKQFLEPVTKRFFASGSGH
ncbi:MAG: folate family ECF transporter S component [Spirochaetaceae bacterium]|nr:folate family ECF transporter S component [Spirochaetaceae bacterium]